MGAAILLGLVVIDGALHWSLFARVVMKPSGVILKWVFHEWGENYRVQ